jgi:hypothetical protein
MVWKLSYFTVATTTYEIFIFKIIPVHVFIDKNLNISFLISDSILLKLYFCTFVLKSLKLSMDFSKSEVGQIHYTNLGGLRFNKPITPIALIFFFNSIFLSLLIFNDTNFMRPGVQLNDVLCSPFLLLKNVEVNYTCQTIVVTFQCCFFVPIYQMKTLNVKIMEYQNKMFHFW